MNWVNASSPPSQLASERTVYILKYVGFMCGYLVAIVAQKCLLAVFVVSASRRLYNSMFTRLMRTPIVFFERNPVGRLRLRAAYCYSNRQ